MFSYEKLRNKLKNDGITQKTFREECGISGGTMGAIMHNESLTTQTLDKICNYFSCSLWDIIEWIPDSDIEKRKELKKQKEIEELEKRLAELKK